ncbi:terpene synthase family protein, partial [Streptomyces bambusae]|nr:germacradienol/geosmin synthase [Streptomyces bambusae]
LGTGAVPGGPGASAPGIRSAFPPRATQLRRRSLSHVPYRKVGPWVTPDLSLPFPLGISPHLDHARRELVDWCRRSGLLQPQPGDPGSALWDERKLVGFDFALCAAGIDPDASPGALALSAQWMAWGTYADDYYPKVFGATRSPGAARAATRRLAAMMPVGPGPAARPAPATVLESSLKDLWARTAAGMGEGMRGEFRKTVLGMLDSWAWEIDNTTVHRVPDPVDYAEMRRWTFGSPTTMLLARLGHRDRGLPPELLRGGVIRSLENAASDVACIVNDLYSYRKEIEVEGEMHNHVLVTETFFGIDHHRAARIVADLMVRRTEEFEHIRDHQLPVLYEDLGLGRTTRGAVDAYVRELEDWMAGILHWHRETRRYRDEDLHPRPAAPGPGTRAAAVGSPTFGMAAATALTRKGSGR